MIVGGYKNKLKCYLQNKIKKKGRKSDSMHTTQVGRTNSAPAKQMDNDICNLLSL